MASDTDFTDDDFTSVDQDFFRRGEEIEHTPPPNNESFEDLDPEPARPPRWPRLRSHVSRVLHAPSQLSRRGRRAAYAGAGLVALCSIALAVPNDDQHLATSVARATQPAPATAPSSALAPAPPPALAPAPAPPPADATPSASTAEIRDHARERVSKPKRDPRRGKSHYDRGLQAWNRGDLDAARRSFAAATRAGHAPGYRALGVLYRKQGKRAEAIRSFRRYLRVAPNSNDAAKVRRTLAALERG